MRDQIRCLKWRPDLINGGKCEELRMTYADPSGPSCGNCCDEYKEAYDSFGCADKDPVIHNKKDDRNHYPCGQDCTDEEAVEKCYTEILYKNRCEFGNTGDPYENCTNFANINQLSCDKATKNVCNNVVKNRTGCICDKNGKCYPPPA